MYKVEDVKKNSGDVDLLNKLLISGQDDMMDLMLNFEPNTIANANVERVIDFMIHGGNFWLYSLLSKEQKSSDIMNIRLINYITTKNKYSLIDMIDESIVNDKKMLTQYPVLMLSRKFNVNLKDFVDMLFRADAVKAVLFFDNIPEISRSFKAKEIALYFFDNLKEILNRDVVDTFVSELCDLIKIEKRENFSLNFYIYELEKEDNCDIENKIIFLYKFYLRLNNYSRGVISSNFFHNLANYLYKNIDLLVDNGDYLFLAKVLKNPIVLSNENINSLARIEKDEDYLAVVENIDFSKNKKNLETYFGEYFLNRFNKNIDAMDSFFKKIEYYIIPSDDFILKIANVVCINLDDNLFNRFCDFLKKRNSIDLSIFNNLKYGNELFIDKLIGKLGLNSMDFCIKNERYEDVLSLFLREDKTVLSVASLQGDNLNALKKFFLYLPEDKALFCLNKMLLNGGGDILNRSEFFLSINGGRELALSYIKDVLPLNEMSTSLKFSEWYFNYIKPEDFRGVFDAFKAGGLNSDLIRILFNMDRKFNPNGDNFFELAKLSIDNNLIYDLKTYGINFIKGNPDCKKEILFLLDNNVKIDISDIDHTMMKDKDILLGFLKLYCKDNYKFSLRNSDKSNVIDFSMDKGSLAAIFLGLDSEVFLDFDFADKVYNMSDFGKEIVRIKLNNHKDKLGGNKDIDIYFTFYQAEKEGNRLKDKIKIKSVVNTIGNVLRRI